MLEILAGLAATVSIIGGSIKFFSWLRSKNPSSPEIEAPVSHQPVQKNEVYALVESFVEIYKNHGIERAQIPRLIGKETGLTLADVSTDEKLLHVLSENVLQTTCDLFGIQREWLEGKDVQIYPYITHGDSLTSYIDFLMDLKKTGAAIQGFAIKRPEDKLLKPEGEHGPYDRFSIALLFRVKLDHWGDISQDSIWKYYPLGDDILWGYERTRLQLKAKILIARMLGIYFKGCEMEADEIDGLVYGRIFPGPLMEHRTHVAWHPEDYIYFTGESACVEDAEEALKVRELYPHMAWREKLEEIVGPIEENTPFKDGKGNPRWFKRVDEMVF